MKLWKLLVSNFRKIFEGKTVDCERNGRVIFCTCISALVNSNLGKSLLHMPASPRTKWCLNHWTFGYVIGNLIILFLRSAWSYEWSMTKSNKPYFQLGNGERDHWGGLGVDGWIILGWISRRWDVGIWTGLGWPRIETVGGPLWVR